MPSRWYIKGTLFHLLNVQSCCNVLQDALPTRSAPGPVLVGRGAALHRPHGQRSLPGRASPGELFLIIAHHRQGMDDRLEQSRRRPGPKFRPAAQRPAAGRRRQEAHRGHSRR